MTKEIKKIGIVGGGKMGTSIFNFLTKYNFQIVWYNRTNADKINNKHIRKLNRALKNNLISKEEFELKIQSQVITNSINDLNDSCLIIECINENLAAKQILINELFTIAKPYTIIASNSSSFKPETLSKNNTQRERIVGLHFFFPVEIKNIVELVLSSYNSAETIKKIEGFLSSINKNYLIQNSESAFLLNRIMLKLQAAAFNFSTKNNCKFKQIDEVVKQHLFPIGIFEMMDHIGIDIIYESAKNYILDEEDKNLFLPIMNFMEQSIKNNNFGIRTGQGFYDYSNTISDLRIDNNKDKQIIKFLIDSYSVAYSWALAISNSKADDLDLYMNEYLDTDTKQWNNID
jgi:3-hydroxybutyryl-CoA dehydrogenase